MALFSSIIAETADFVYNGKKKISLHFVIRQRIRCCQFLAVFPKTYTDNLDKKGNAMFADERNTAKGKKERNNYEEL